MQTWKNNEKKRNNKQQQKHQQQMDTDKEEHKEEIIAEKDTSPSSSSSDEYEEATGKLLKENHHHHHRHHYHHQHTRHRHQVIAETKLENHQVEEEALATELDYFHSSNQEPTLSTASTLLMSDTLRSRRQRWVGRRDVEETEALAGLVEGGTDGERRAFKANAEGGFSKVRKMSSRWFAELFGNRRSDATVAEAVGQPSSLSLGGDEFAMDRATFECDNYNSNNDETVIMDDAAIMDKDKNDVDKETATENGELTMKMMGCVHPKANYIKGGGDNGQRRMARRKKERRNVFPSNYNCNSSSVNLADNEDLRDADEDVVVRGGTGSVGVDYYHNNGGPSASVALAKNRGLQLFSPVTSSTSTNSGEGRKYPPLSLHPSLHYHSHCKADRHLHHHHHHHPPAATHRDHHHHQSTQGAGVASLTLGFSGNHPRDDIPPVTEDAAAVSSATAASGLTTVVVSTTAGRKYEEQQQARQKRHQRRRRRQRRGRGDEQELSSSSSSDDVDGTAAAVEATPRNANMSMSIQRHCHRPLARDNGPGNDEWCSAVDSLDLALGNNNKQIARERVGKKREGFDNPQPLGVYLPGVVVDRQMQQLDRDTVHLVHYHEHQSKGGMKKDDPRLSIESNGDGDDTDSEDVVDEDDIIGNAQHDLQYFINHSNQRDHHQGDEAEEVFGNEMAESERRGWFALGPKKVTKNTMKKERQQQQKQTTSDNKKFYYSKIAIQE